MLLGVRLKHRGHHGVAEIFRVVPDRKQLLALIGNGFRLATGLSDLKQCFGVGGSQRVEERHQAFSRFLMVESINLA